MIKGTTLDRDSPGSSETTAEAQPAFALLLPGEGMGPYIIF